MEYRGIFQEGVTYAPGDFVVFGGSVWRCKVATSEKPGGDDWGLAVRKGKDKE